MPKPRRKPPRERLGPDLERVTLPDVAKFVYSGAFSVFCPRCQRDATVGHGAHWLILSCGCYWHPPRKERGHDEGSWVSYQEAGA